MAGYNITKEVSLIYKEKNAYTFYLTIQIRRSKFKQRTGISLRERIRFYAVGAANFAHGAFGGVNTAQSDRAKIFPTLRVCFDDASSVAIGGNVQIHVFWKIWTIFAYAFVALRAVVADNRLRRHRNAQRLR